jgi:hypothetical protein
MGVEPRRDEIALAKGLCNVEDEGLHDWGRPIVPPFQIYLAFALQLRKCTENLSQVSRLELDISRCADSIPLNPPALYSVIKSFHTILKNVVGEIIRKRKCKTFLQIRHRFGVTTF